MMERKYILMWFHAALISVDTRLYKMYEKAKADHTFRTDITMEEFMRVTVHTMITACIYYKRST